MTDESIPDIQPKAMDVDFQPDEADDKRIAWLKARKNGIGGSDAPAIMKLSRFSTPFSVWLDKTSPDIDDEASERMHWGTVLEDQIAAEWSRRTSKRIVPEAMRWSPDTPFMFANMDRRVVGEEAGLECKNRGIEMLRTYELDGPSLYEQCQCQHYMAVTGWDHWYLAVLFGGNTFRSWRLPRNDGFIRTLVAAERTFWLDHVKTKVPPDIDGTRDCAAYLLSLNPASDGECVDLDKSLLESFEDLVLAKDQLAQWEDIKATAGNKIKQALGSAEVGTCGPFRAKWKSVNTKSGNPQRRFTFHRIPNED